MGKLLGKVFGLALAFIIMLEGCGKPSKKCPFVVTIPGVTEPGPIPGLRGIWAGLEIGHTTHTELLQWLETSPFVDRGSLQSSSRTSPYGVQEHIYKWDLTAGCWKWLAISVISETVSSVHFPILYHLTLGQVIEQIGEPEYILAGDVYYGSHCFYTVKFNYPNLGLVVIADSLPCNGIQQDRATGEKTGPLEPEFQVSFIKCTQPGTLEEIIQSLYATSPEAAALETKQHQRWLGFGRVRLFRPLPGSGPTP